MLGDSQNPPLMNQSNVKFEVKANASKQLQVLHLAETHQFISFATVKC